MLKSGVLAEPVLVGRERELEELQRYLDSAIEGKGTAVFISGEAGSGKTRLLREFLNRAKKGVATLTGWCLSNAAVPYFPFFEAFNAYFSGEYEPKGIRPEELEVKSWLIGPTQAEKLGKTQAVSPQVWKDQTFVAVARTLSSISARKPTILFIDDVHWADSASLALIHYIARAIDSEKVLVLATFRSEQLASDAEGRPHPLVETLRLMRREDIVEEIKIANLNQEDVSAMAKNMLGGDLQEQFAEKLADESQGNPLFVVESLRMLHERDGLIQERDQWRLASDEFEIPAKIKDIILQRLGLLSRNQREVLDAASVIGEKFDIELLASVLGQDSLGTVKTLDAIAKNTSLVCCDEELYRFDHARSRDVVYDEISAALKRGYHDRVAEKLEAVGKGGKLPVSDLAYHFAQAGDKERAVKYAFAAGQDALARWSNAEAIKQFTYILKTVGEDPNRVEERTSALEGLGDAFYANSMFREATRIFEDIANTVETGVVQLRALRKAMNSAFQYGDCSHLMELVKKAEPYAAADRLENARVLYSAGWAFALQNMYPAALEDYKAALQVFEEEYSLWDAALGMLGVGVSYANLGMPQQGLAESLRSIVLFEELGDFRMQMEAYWAAGTAFMNSSLAHESLKIYGKVIEIDEKTKMGDYIRPVYANAFSAIALNDIGNFQEALLHNLKALELSKKTDSPLAHGLVYSNLTKQYAMLGDMEHAEEYFEKLIKLPPEIIISPWVDGVAAKAIFYAGKNQWKESNQYFKEVFESLKSAQRKNTGYEAGTKEEHAWALERQGRFEEARVQLEEARRIRREAEVRFEHADLQAHLMARRQSVVGEEFEMRLDLVNVGKKPALLVKVENVLPDDFKVTGQPSWCSVQNENIEMKNREIGAFQVEPVKLTLKALNAGAFTIDAKALYVDDLGQTKTCRLNAVNITVRQAPPKVRPGRVSSGMAELDDLLLGGIPENYSVILTATSSDERELLIKRFLETAAQAGQTTLYLTTEAGNAKALAEAFPANFSLFLCSPQAELMTENLPNICKPKGVDNLTEIDIALAKYFRTLDPSRGGPRIACIKIVSDVLLQHHAVIARKWLSSLLVNLKSRGFTTIAVINPQMHPQEELQAILGLFEGEISISEKETPKGVEKVLRIRKLYNQKYLENELTLTRERLQQQLQKQQL